MKRLLLSSAHLRSRPRALASPKTLHPSSRTLSASPTHSTPRILQSYSACALHVKRGRLYSSHTRLRRRPLASPRTPRRLTCDLAAQRRPINHDAQTVLLFGRARQAVEVTQAIRHTALPSEQRPLNAHLKRMRLSCSSQLPVCDSARSIHQRRVHCSNSELSAAREPRTTKRKPCFCQARHTCRRRSWIPQTARLSEQSDLSVQREARTSLLRLRTHDSVRSLHQGRFV